MGGIHGMEMEDGSDGWKIHGSHGVELIWGHQSTAKTMVEAWVALFGWIHGVDLKASQKGLQQHY